MSTYPVPPRNRTGNRTGYTTGSNAAAAAKAATIALLTGEWPAEVTITLPIGETATMTPVEMATGENWAYCCMVKDAGDDPDVTHGALICARVEKTSTTGIALDGGEGVGRITLPGIGLPVGDPAINPVPRQQIRDNVANAIDEAAIILEENGDHFRAADGLSVVVSVPAGQVLAEKTLNARLGILGGISILGTTGKVFAYSTASWRASVIQAVEVAASNNADKVVMATGGRSERFGMEIFPELPKVAFVQLSIFTGAGLETCVQHGVKSAVFVGMIGKMIKTAQGHMTTHVAGNQVDFEFLAQICRDVDAPQPLIDAVLTANTGRHFLELCTEHDFMPPVTHMTDVAYDECEKFIAELGGTLELDVILVDFNGNILARKTGDVVSTLATETDEVKPLIERLADDPSTSYDGDEDGRDIQP